MIIQSLSGNHIKSYLLFSEFALCYFSRTFARRRMIFLVGPRDIAVNSLPPLIM